MTVRELIKMDFGIDLPIRGGNGNSKDNPVIIEYDGEQNDYIGCEYTYVRCLCTGRELKEWKIIGQALLRYNDRIIDKIKFTHIEVENGQRFVVTENYYFDITECYGKKFHPYSNSNESGINGSTTIDTITSANEYNLIDTFFNGQADYVKFLVQLKKKAKANKEATCMAELTKEDGCYKYMLYWLKDNDTYIGDYVKPFRASIENINTFNKGCKILADRLAILIKTKNVDLVPETPPAFGELTHII